MRAVFSFLFTFAVFISLFAQDSVTTTDGKNLQGLILDVRDDYLLLKASDGQIHKLWRREVKDFNLTTFLATLLLEDGIRVRGRGEFDSIKVKTLYGVLNVPASELRGIVTARLRKQIFMKRAQTAFESLVKIWEQTAHLMKKQRENVEEEETGWTGWMKRFGWWGGRGGTIVVPTGRDEKGEAWLSAELERLKNGLKDVYRFVENEVEERLKKTKLKMEREFWQKLREEALAIEPYALEEDDLIVTKRFDILGRAEIQRIVLQTPYGKVEVAFDKLLAISFGTTLSIVREIMLKPSADFIPLRLSVKEGDAVEVQAKGTLNIGGTEIPPIGGSMYGRQIRGLEVKVGDKVIGGEMVKKFAAPCDGELSLRFDLSALRWVDPEEIGGEFSITVIIHGAGIPLPQAEPAKSSPSKGEQIKRLLFGSEE
ncbi:MAG: hypothetical protein N2234_05585 [Planctomycetota bacterium]|nr:hypothetical protein [Planctomycetota bacterium]